MRQFYYNLRQLLQNALILFTKYVAITKCAVYYKMRRYKQISLLFIGRF